MKKLISILIAIAMLCAPALASEEDEIIAALEEAIADRIPIDEYAYLLDVSMIGTVDLHLNALEQITDYGSYIYYLMNAVAEIYPEARSVDFTLSDGALTNSRFLVFTGYPQETSYHYGDLVDYRSGVPVSYEIETLDDLIALFPAMAADGIGSGVDQADLDIYNEVIDILYANYTRPEAEVLEEIAPNYGMTGDELSQFIDDIMMQIYS